MSIMLMQCLYKHEFTKKTYVLLLHMKRCHSHALFTVHVHHRDYPERGGQLTFVDLAGSEKIINTGVTGKMLKEVRLSLVS